MNTEYKYIEVEIEMTVFTSVNMKVPVDFSSEDLSLPLLKDIVKKVVDKHDWNNDEESLDWQSINDINKEGAEQYPVYEVKK